MPLGWHSVGAEEASCIWTVAWAIFALLACWYGWLVLILYRTDPFLFRLWMTFLCSASKWVPYCIMYHAWMLGARQWPSRDDALISLAAFTFPYIAKYSGDRTLVISIMSFLTRSGNTWRSLSPNLTKSEVERAMQQSGLRIPQRVKNCKAEKLVEELVEDRAYFLKPEGGCQGRGHYIKFRGREASAVLPCDYEKGGYIIQEYVQSKYHKLAQHIRICSILENGTCAYISHFLVFSQTDPTCSTSNWNNGKNGVIDWWIFSPDGQLRSSDAKCTLQDDFVRELTTGTLFKSLLEAHQANPELARHHSIGWDVVWAADGPVILEYNGSDHGDLGCMPNKSRYMASLKEFNRLRGEICHSTDI